MRSSIIVVTRRRLRPGETLQRRGDQELLQLQRRLKNFDLLEGGQAEIGGRPAIYLRFASWSRFGPLEQSITMVEGQADDGARLLIIFATSTPPDKAAAARPIFKKIFESVTRRSPLGAAARAHANGAPGTGA
jgi:hypothetical protein